MRQVLPVEAKNLSWGTGATTALFTLPILYVLSLGPAIYVADRGGMQEPATKKIVAAIYHPLDLLYRKTPLRTPLDWYISHWRAN